MRLLQRVGIQYLGKMRISYFEGGERGGAFVCHAQLTAGADRGEENEQLPKLVGCVHR